MPVTQHPLHRSVRAELPHTAPALGFDDQTLIRVRVADMENRKPVRNDSMHSSPAQVMGLAAPAQCAVPQPAYLEAEHAQPRAVVGHAKVPAMPGHHRAQVLALLFDGSVHAPSEFDLERLQFSSQAFATGEPQHHEFALSARPAAMREPQEVKGLRFSHSRAASVIPGEAPELDQPRLLGMQRQSKGLQPLGHLPVKLLGVVAELEPRNPVIGIPHHDDLAPGVSIPPLARPQVKRIVQVDVGQQRTNHATYTKDNFEFERRIALNRTLRIIDMRRKK